MNEEIKLTKKEPTWNYILNDLALYSLMTKVIYSEYATSQEKFDFMYQIELLQQENKQLKHIIDELEKWLKETKLKEFEKEYGKRYGKVYTQAEIIVFNMILNKLQELKGSDKE